MKTTTPVVAAAAGQVFKGGSRVGRGIPEITDVYTKKCSCSREKTIVFCRACGYYCNGRIRLKCEQHPRVEIDIMEELRWKVPPLKREVLPPGLVLCLGTGRGPNDVTFLLDIAECPRCHSSAFLDEYSGSP